MTDPKNNSDLSFRKTSKRSSFLCPKNVDSINKKKKFSNTNKVVEAKVDDSKRLFLKIAGVAGLGLAASALFPKSADAYVAGSTPTSNVVGVKDSANTRIDPAKETGGNLASVKTNTDPLVTSGAGGYVRQDSTGTIAKETGGNLESIKTNTDNLAGIKSNTDKFTFDGGSLMVTGAASGGSSASVVGLKDSLNIQINPASDDSVVMLRRMLRMMESLATVDQWNRQRVTVSEVYGAGASVANQTPRVTVANDSSIILATGSNAIGSLTAGAAVIGSLTNLATIAGQNQQMYQDGARNAFANGIRQNLIFS